MPKDQAQSAARAVTRFKSEQAEGPGGRLGGDEASGRRARTQTGVIWLGVYEVKRVPHFHFTTAKAHD